MLSGDSTIGGSVQLDNGQGATLSAARITGNVQLVGNRSLLWLQDLQVGGDIQLFGNRAGATLHDNRADGKLQCEEDVPAPGGGGNEAASRQDQCSGL